MAGSFTMSGPKISLRRRLAMWRSLICRLASGHSRHDRDLVLLGQFGGKAGAEADVLVVEVHVHELPELALWVQQAVLETRIALLERVDRRSEIGRFDRDGHLAFGEAPKWSGDAELRHAKYSPFPETTSGSVLFRLSGHGRRPRPVHRRS